MTRPLIGIGADVTQGEERQQRAFGYLTYVAAILEAGGTPVIIPPQPGNVAELLARLDGIVLAGGPDCDPAAYGEACHATVQPMDARRQANDVALASTARRMGVPALGICLGLQVMNISSGGSLIQDIPSQHSTGITHTSEPGAPRVRHDVRIDPDTRLGAIIGGGDVNVNSSHHQAVNRVASGMRVTAVAPDDLVEGLEDPNHPFYLGVQWHPEDMRGEASSTSLFAAFVAAAKRRAEARDAATDLSPAGSGVSE